MASSALSESPSVKSATLGSLPSRLRNPTACSDRAITITAGPIGTFLCGQVRGHMTLSCQPDKHYSVNELFGRAFGLQNFSDRHFCDRLERFGWAYNRPAMRHGVHLREEGLILKRICLAAALAFATLAGAGAADRSVAAVSRPQGGSDCRRLHPARFLE